MNSESEKMVLIRSYVSQTFPSCHIKDGSRTDTDRTLQLLEGGTLKCTIQIGLDLLRHARPSSSEVALALKDKDIVGWVHSAPVVYLNNNTLGIKDG